jgi:hypothetical protein
VAPDKESEFDFDFSVPGECLGDFKALLRAGIDALGDDPDDDRAAALGKELLDDLAKLNLGAA